MMFMGSVGTGKTHMGAAICWAAVGAGYKARFATLDDMLDEICATWTPHAKEIESTVVARFSNVHVLFLDELRPEPLIDKDGRKKELLFKVLNKRNANGFPTILATNLEVDAWRELLGGEVVSRLKSKKGGAISMKWEDYRGK